MSIAPELKRPFLEKLVVRLYARAGQLAAGEARLTEPAIKTLDEDPTAIHRLIQQSLLSVTAVDKRFLELLEDVCSNASDNVRRSLAGLVWMETTEGAKKWLVGEKLEPVELDKLRLSGNLSAETDASGVLISLGALHRYFRVPFALAIDELGHFTRYDDARNSKRNVTWLKRLLEGLAGQHMLMLVAGHLSAWENILTISSASHSSNP